jgi:hypothetical protein
VSAEENKTLVRRFIEEAWVKGNSAAVDEFMASDYLEHPLPSGMPPGPEGLNQLIVTRSSQTASTSGLIPRDPPTQTR